MDHFEFIYTHRAAAYHRMIAAEDADGSLLPAIEGAAPIAGREQAPLHVLDLGTGSGRIPLLLQGRPAVVVGLDLHLAMLRENQAQRRLVKGNWDLVQGDMRRLPIDKGWADLVIAGWAIGHLRSWHPEDWQAQMGGILKEMRRVLRTGGTLVILETLTTGALEPAPPTPELADYYAWLEGEQGFSRTAIRTDYQFSSVEEAVAAMEFFFGPGLAAAIRRNRWSRVPEWTGVWSQTISFSTQQSASRGPGKM